MEIGRDTEWGMKFGVIGRLERDEWGECCCRCGCVPPLLPPLLLPPPEERAGTSGGVSRPVNGLWLHTCSANLRAATGGAAHSSGGSGGSCGSEVLRQRLRVFCRHAERVLARLLLLLLLVSECVRVVRFIRRDISPGAVFLSHRDRARVRVWLRLRLRYVVRRREGADGCATRHGRRY